MLQPILDRVLVRRVEEKSEGEVVIPDAFRQESNKGEVIATGQFFIFGNQRMNVSEVVRPGDIVLFGEYNAEPITLDGEKYLLVRVQDIRGIERACGDCTESSETAALKNSSAGLTTLLA